MDFEKCVFKIRRYGVGNKGGLRVGEKSLTIAGTNLGEKQGENTSPHTH